MRIRSIAAQSSVEFLMTYGWALVLLLSVLGALAYFGIFQAPSFFSQDKCELYGGFVCDDFAFSGDTLLLSVQNTKGENVVLAEGITVDNAGENCNLIFSPSSPSSILLPSGSTKSLFFQCDTITSTLDATLTFMWSNQLAGLTSTKHTATGFLSIRKKTDASLARPRGFTCTEDATCASGVCDTSTSPAICAGCTATSCADNHYCRLQDKTCTPSKKLGESCASERCASGLRCDTASVLCKVVVAVGGSCAVTDDCVSGATCEGRVCKVGVGGSCAVTDDCVSGTACRGSPAVCEAGVAVGDMCTDHSDCPDSVCYDGSCRSRVGDMCSADDHCVTDACDTVNEVCARKIITFAGNGMVGFSGEDVPAINAQLNNTRGVAVDGAGNVYIADRGNHRVRKVNSTGHISTFAGDGTAGFSGDGGLATSAQLSSPQGVAVDSVGNVYIADWLDHRVRKVNSTGHISTFAGTGVNGFNGDTNPAESAQLKSPQGVAVDGDGNCILQIGLIIVCVR